MKKVLIIAIVALGVPVATAQTAEQLIQQAIEAVGGKDNFYAQKDVTYNIHYKTPPGENAIEFKGQETYIFDGELSHGDYEIHTISGADEEGYDGDEFWVKMDGSISENEKAIGVARFLRKTNYYWFAMFFKLQDDGVHYEKLGDQKLKGKAYHRIKMTFGNNVGDSQDTYILYINKKTKLIDQFLFTITGFGITEPNLMSFDKWETINGVKIPTGRKYIKADWEGNVKDKEYTHTDWTNIKFNTGVERTSFSKTSSK